MKKRRNPNMLSYVNLYIKYIFQRTTLIIFITSIVLMTISLVLVANPWIKKDEYIIDYNEIHKRYLELSLLIIFLFNSIVIATITISITISSISFDSLFLSYTKRSNLCISKLIAMSLVLLYLSIIEIFIFYLIPILCYSRFNIKNFLITIPCIIYSLLFEALISTVFTTLLPTIFSSLSISFIFIVTRILCNNSKNIENVISQIIPVIIVDNETIFTKSILISPIWLTLLILLYINIYNIKDLRQS